MEWFGYSNVKYGFSTRAVPPETLASISPMTDEPEVGDLVLTEVLSVGKNKTVEDRLGLQRHLFPGDRVVGVFGSRYATDQFEGYVPRGPVEVCDMLSVGGVCGEEASRHLSMPKPTQLRVLGTVVDSRGRTLNSRSYGLPFKKARGGVAEVILVVGSTMDSGKTTTAGFLARSLSRSGFRVAAAKVTGTASSKDVRFLESCGARPVLDFTSAGYPSTYMLGEDELLAIYDTLLAHLQEGKPDYIILEVADGIFQRETRMMLGSATIRDATDHIFFAAADSLAAECGVRHLTERGLPLRATSGALTQSELMIREAEEASGLPCLGTDRIMNGALDGLLGLKKQSNDTRVPVLTGSYAG